MKHCSRFQSLFLLWHYSVLTVYKLLENLAKFSRWKAVLVAHCYRLRPTTRVWRAWSPVGGGVWHPKFVLSCYSFVPKTFIKRLRRWKVRQKLESKFTGLTHPWRWPSCRPRRTSWACPPSSPCWRRRSRPCPLSPARWGSWCSRSPASACQPATNRHSRPHHQTFTNVGISAVLSVFNNNLCLHYIIVECAWSKSITVINSYTSEEPSYLSNSVMVLRAGYKVRITSIKYYFT